MMPRLKCYTKLAIDLCDEIVHKFLLCSFRVLISVVVNYASDCRTDLAGSDGKNPCFGLAGSPRRRDVQRDS